MLILLNNFLSFITVSLVLLNLFLESSEHSFLRLWCFRFISLNVCVVFCLNFIRGILEFICKFANETTELLVSAGAFFITLRTIIGCLLFNNYLLNDLWLFLVRELSIFTIRLWFITSDLYLLWYSSILWCWRCYWCFRSFYSLRLKRVIKR